MTCSPSDTTLSLLDTMLAGFDIISASSVDAARSIIEAQGPKQQPLDVIILDDQYEKHAEELSIFIRSLGYPPLQNTKILHLYTPTTDGQALFSKDTPGVVKMTKPPRKARLLQTLAGLKHVSYVVSNTTQAKDAAKALEDLASSRRTLFGNVLIAEGKLIVLAKEH